MRRVLLILGLFTAWAAFGLNTATVHAAQGPPSVTPRAVTPITLAPTKTPTLAARFKLGSYVHAANCRAALAGANGDNDVQSWINSHSPYGIRHYQWTSGAYHYGPTRVVVFADMYNGDPLQFWGNVGGYCMGDDSAIVDKFGDPPSGW